VTDALLLAAGGRARLLVARPSRRCWRANRGIFFAMLTLALSMVLYGC
jgi:hypothetical protein